MDVARESTKCGVGGLSGGGVALRKIVEALEKIRYACEKDRLYVGLFCMRTWEEKSGEWGLLKLKGK